MAKKLFDLDQRELKQLIKFYKKAPAKMTTASAGMLNTFAFETRKKSLHIINTAMTVRAKGFVKGSIKVDKAGFRDPINKQQSQVGSIVRPRFTGWEEQEDGKVDKRKRIATSFARGGNNSGKIKPSNRMKANNTFESPDDFAGKSKDHRVTVMLQVLFRKRHRKPFIIKGSRKWKPGLYRIQAGKRLRMLQSFEPNKKPIKRVRWMSGGRKAFFRKADMRKLWGNQLRSTLKIK